MMLRIDAHQHFWDPKRGDYGWMNPEDRVLYRVYGPLDLEPFLLESGIGGTVLVQAAPTVAETDYMLSIAEHSDWVLGVVGWVDFEDPRDRSALERLKRHPKFCGVRPMIQDIADTDWMLRRDLDWAFRSLVELDLTFDALTFPRHLPNLLTLLGRWPDLRVVVDHGSKPAIRDGAFDDWARDMAAIAAQTSALCKLSGLVTEARPDWTVETLRPYVQHLLATFGPGRLIFGSDWPVCTLASSYVRWIEAADELTSDCTAGERLAIFGGNAAAFYRLPER